ncbi:MAG TPA: FecR domain-containing protein [Planctomicrobium sp.]|nr:FecR domain-containing protein [Planctomicrobium sp.]
MDKSFHPEEFRRLVESLLNGTLTESEEARLQETLARNQAARQYYLNYIDMHVGLLLDGRKRTGKSLPKSVSSEPVTQRRLPRKRYVSRKLLLSAAGLIVLVVGWNYLPGTPFLPAIPDGGTPAISLAESSLAKSMSDEESQPVILAEEAGAIFYHELTPRVGSSLKWNRSYSLLQGQIELQFPRGARAIFESPAVFEVKSAEQVQVLFGSCSVYAPEGSEGFEVLTPATQFIDRGTRFLVKVDESGGSDVHVIEGLVDAVRSKQSGAAQLRKGEARRYTGNRSDVLPSSTIRYSPSTYRSQLPDRLVRFSGRKNEHEELERLEEVQVRRGGKPYRYSINELIGGDVTSFCELGLPEKANLTNFILPLDFNGDLSDLLLHDDSFLTGILNPGGNPQPHLGQVLTPLETTERSQWTPGMTVTFRSPVVNSPGPDILIFDAHTTVHPISGDAFHVRPLELKPGYRPLTVRNYDIGMLSNESHRIGGFHLLQMSEPVACLQELLEKPLSRGNISLYYRVIGTGIDLSDMGVPEGEAVSAIFIQDVLDDEHRLDPVMFVGLPEIPSENTSR